MRFKFWASVTDAYVVSLSGDWQKAYERVIVWCVATGGLALGLALVAVSPSGLDSADVIGGLALVVGLVALGDLLLGRGRPIPYLTVVTLLVGAMAPLVDDTLAMALNALVVTVLATGALLIQRVRGFWVFTALALVVMTVRPALTFAGWEPALSLQVPATVPWLVAVTALLTGAVGFRALRDRIMLRDAYYAEVNHLVSSLAHRLRTPLTGMLGFGHLIAGEVLTEDGQDFAHRIVENGWDLSATLDDLVIAARSHAGGLEMLRRPVSLGVMVDEVVRSVPGAAQKLSYCSVKGTAIGDPARIRQILRHLISNAVDHGGPNVVIYSRTDEKGVVVSVVDDGPGIGESDRKKAFDWYFHRSDDENVLGAGIGLSVSRVLAEAMGGDVELSNDHSGTTAALRLPADPRSIKSSAMWPASTLGKPARQ